MTEPQAIREWHGVDAQTFRSEVAARYEPAVLRGVARDWPMVRAAGVSADAARTYLARFDTGAEVDAIILPPTAKGRIFYNDALTGFNFSRSKLPVSAVCGRLARYEAFQNRPAIAVQSALIAECLPGFERENALGLLDATIEPRIWLGNAVTTPAHFDESSNVAVVVAGRRRFTLFSPDEIGNLYIGPIDFAPTGTPISLVDFDQPDLARFPSFETAMSRAQAADLEPGDAIYIPALWWHHVRSLAKFNVLVNYWWKGAPDAPSRHDSALDCLLHAMLDLRHLPEAQRRAWAGIFAHYVFDAASDPSGHIPAHRRGILGDITPEMARQVRAFLVGKMTR